MKTTVKRPIRDQEGNVLILVLVVLVVGGLILTPLLGLMGTGLVAGQVYEKKTAELYAADAGVEDAIWKIKYDPPDPYPYEYPEPLTVNDKSVDVVILSREDLDPTCHTQFRYRILSTATSDDGSATTIEAVLMSVSLNYSDLTGNAITSGGDVTVLGEQGQVVGDISLPPDGEFKPEDYEDEYENGVVKREELIWPELGEFAEFYKQDVESGTHYYLDTVIDINGHNSELGPLYVDGTLDIVNSDNTPATLTLTGTIYSTGDIFINGSGAKGTLYLDLNEETIFVASRSGIDDSKKALWIADKCAIEGSGAIIAIGDIYFEPNIELGMTEPILIMSVRGKTHLQPSGDFYGSIVGNAEVYVSPGNMIIYPDGGFGEINFPGLIEGKEGYSIESWEIK